MRTTVLRAVRSCRPEPRADRRWCTPRRSRRRRTDRRGAQRRARRVVHDGARQGLRHTRRQVRRGRAHRGDRLAPQRVLGTVAERRRCASSRHEAWRSGSTPRSRPSIADGVELADGTRIASHAVIWCAGVKANPLADLLGLSQTARGEVDRQHRPQRRRPSRGVRDRRPRRDHDRRGRPYPQLAPVAMQQARHVARNIVRRIDGRKTRRFRYVDKGTMATIGRRSAVAELPLRIRLRRDTGLVELARIAPRVPRRVPEPSRGVRQLGVELPHVGPREPDHHPAGLTPPARPLPL